MNMSGLVLMSSLFIGQANTASVANESVFDALIAEAQRAQTGNDFATAAEAYKRAVALRPDIPELWTNLGLMDHETGNIPEAVTSFRKAVRLNGTLFAPNLFLGIDLLEEKNYPDALQYLQRAERINPSDDQAPLAVGRAYATLQQPLLASAAYAKAAQLNEKNADAWFGLGLMSLKQVENDARLLTEEYKTSSFLDALGAEAFTEESKPVEAATFFERALNSTTVPMCTRTQYGFLLLREHKLEQAEDAFNAEARGSFSCPVTAIGMTRLQLEKGDEEKAWSTLVVLWKANEDVVRANRELLWMGLGPEESNQILGSLDQAVARGTMPEQLGKLLRLGLQHPGLEHDSLTLQLETSIVDHRACNPGTHTRMKGRQEANSLLTATACAFYSADYWSSSQQARRLSNTPQTRAEGLYWEIKSDQKLAVAALKRADAYAPDSPKMHVVIGDIYRERQHFDEAAAEYDKALSLSPSDRGARFGLSVTQFMQGHTDDALSGGERLLKGDPHDARTNLLVGEALVKLRRFVEAEIYLERSLEGDSELHPRAHALLGQCFRENGDDTKAIREFEQALSGDDDGSVHYQLAVLYRKSGDRATAASLMEDSNRIREDRLRSAAIRFQEVQQNSADANNVK